MGTKWLQQSGMQLIWVPVFKIACSTIDPLWCLPAVPGLLSPIVALVVTAKPATPGCMGRQRLYF